MRHLGHTAAIATCVAVLASCQTAKPPTGSMWGYVSQSENVASLRVLAPDGRGVSPRPPTR
jgi:hypothetical protein